MKIPDRLQKRIPDVSAVTPFNADLILSRLRIEIDRRGTVQKASIGSLAVGMNHSRWPRVANVSWNWLRKGAYKVRMFQGKQNEILQIAAPWWGQHLVHPTSNWRSLRGCISVGEKFDYNKNQLINSLAAHTELMKELGPFELHKEFTLYVWNNPVTKNPDATRANWAEQKLRTKLRMGARSVVPQLSV